MRGIFCRAFTIVLVLLGACGMAAGQIDHQVRTVSINGHSGQAAVIQEKQRLYIDVQAVAQIGNGSLSFSGNQIALTLPPSAGSPAAPSSPTPQDDNSLSRDFMRAGIEVTALLREWASPVAYAIQNGYQMSAEQVANYRENAAQGLQMASVAATTNGDKNAFQLLTNEFQGVRQWSDNLITAQKNMNTAQYSMSPGTLRNEPQSRKLVTCWHFLASMLESGSFQDDSSCH